MVIRRPHFQRKWLNFNTFNTMNILCDFILDSREARLVHTEDIHYMFNYMKIIQGLLCSNYQLHRHKVNVITNISSLRLSKAYFNFDTSKSYCFEYRPRLRLWFAQSKTRWIIIENRTTVWNILSWYMTEIIRICFVGVWRVANIAKSKRGNIIMRTLETFEYRLFGWYR